MISFDMRTLIFSFLITDLIITFVMVVLWIQTRKHFFGTIFWVADFAFQTIALALIALRGTVPDWISMVLSNTLVIAGSILGLIGLEYFTGIRRRNVPNWVLLAVFISIHTWFSVVKPDLQLRNLNLAVTFLIIGLQVCWLVGVRLKGEMRRLTIGIGIIFMFYNLVNIGRVVNFFTVKHPGDDYFDPNVFESLVLVFYQMLFLLLTYALIMMFNKRLGLKIIKQEERYSKAFNSSPYANIITRRNNEEIFEINDGFSNITGYSHSEAIGKTTKELGLWLNEEDRLIVVNKLMNKEKVHEIEFGFRIKSGEIISGLITSEIMTLNDEVNIFSSINDITQRKKVEAEIKLNEARLESLLRISTSESKTLQSFLDNALSEAISLTQSKIGYIYFYSEERKEFTLNSWSEKVMEACKVLEQQTIYQLEKTGIWGEAVRQRKPIVINDFHAVNPLKKGYPEGHVQLDKFLTIPVFADNRIVAVVAVANKETDYNDADVRQLTLMMGSVWNITEKMRIEESLKNTQAILMAAMDCSPSGIAIADAPDGKLRYVNKAGLMIPAKSEDEIVDDIDISNYASSWNIKHHDGTLYKPDEVPLARAVLYGETNSREFIISRDEIDDRVVLANAAPILDDHGVVKAGIVVFHDITDYKKAEELIRQQYFTLKGMNDSTKSPIFSVDKKYCYTSFNKTHSNVMKLIYNVDIEIGKSLLDYMTNSEDRSVARKNLDRTLSGESFSEEAFSGEEGLSRIYFEVTHNPIFNDSSEVIGAAVLARDLTKRKELEIELNNKITELEKFNKIMVGREIRMVELKQEINELCGKLKIPKRYKTEEEKGSRQ